VVFQNAVEGFFRVLPPLSARARERFGALGITPEGPFLPAYTSDQMQDLEEIAAEELFPALDRSHALRRVGELQVEGFAKTALGTALFALLRILGRRRSLERVTRSWRSANNYVETKVTEIEPDVVHIWVNYAGRNPEICLGILSAALEATNQRPRQATVFEAQFPSAVYRFDWR
jgi:uncharacterized protein (TIGR02265 family)